MTFCHKEYKFFLFNERSPAVLKSDYHVQKDFFVGNKDYIYGIIRSFFGDALS